MDNYPKQLNADSNVSPEQLARLRKIAKQEAWEERREANKPKSVRDEERATALARFILFVFSKEFVFEVFLPIILPFILFFGFVLPFVLSWLVKMFQ